MLLFELYVKVSDIGVIEVQDAWGHHKHELASGVGLKADMFGVLLDEVAHGGSDDFPVDGEDAHVVEEDDA